MKLVVIHNDFKSKQFNYLVSIENGDNYFLVQDDQVGLLVERFNNWRNGLGLCGDTYDHQAAEHFHIEVANVQDLPDSL